MIKLNKLIVVVVFLVITTTATTTAMAYSNMNNSVNQENIGYFYFNESPSDSMYPAINKTSIAYVEKITNENQLKVNDIILFKLPKSWIPVNVKSCFMAHRIIKIKEDVYGKYYVTKGDNNLLSDFYLKTRINDIYYKVTEIK